MMGRYEKVLGARCSIEYRVRAALLRMMRMTSFYKTLNMYLFGNARLQDNSSQSVVVGRTVGYVEPVIKHRTTYILYTVVESIRTIVPETTIKGVRETRCNALL